MKKIEAIIRPYMLGAVKESLEGIAVKCMTVGEVHGYGRQRGHPEMYWGSEYQMDSVPKIKIEIIVPEALEDHVVSIITKATQTGRFGDGKISVLSIDDCIRIRTGE